MEVQQANGAAGGNTINAPGSVLFGDTPSNTNSGSTGANQQGGVGAPGAGTQGNTNTGGQAAAQQVSIPANWKDSLPADLKELPFMNLVNDIPTLVKNYANAQKMVGADKIAVPSSNASKEDWQVVFGKLGLPKTVEEYKVDIPKEMEIDKDFNAALVKVAHENGILPNQTKALAEFLYNTNKTTIEKDNDAYKSSVEGNLKKLQGEWGEAYKTNVAKARAALLEFADKDTQEAIRSSGMGNNIHLLKLLAKVGATLSEDKIRGEGITGGFSKTPAQAQAELDVIHRDLKHPYYVKDHPEHNAAKMKVRALHEAAAFVTQNS
jgi:hypothetical protein